MRHMDMRKSSWDLVDMNVHTIYHTLLSSIQLIIHHIKSLGEYHEVPRRIWCDETLFWRYEVDDIKMDDEHT